MLDVTPIRWLATALALTGGFAAIYAYISWALRVATARNPLWFVYFMVLFMSETLFVLVYADGLFRYPQPTQLPTGLVEFFLLFGIPISVGMSAFGWFALYQKGAPPVPTPPSDDT